MTSFFRLEVRDDVCFQDRNSGQISTPPSNFSETRVLSSFFASFPITFTKIGYVVVAAIFYNPTYVSAL
jgi:hypothetical protein